MSLTEMPPIDTAALLLPFLGAAAVTDLLNRKIPNVLIVLMFACGLAVQLASMSLYAVLWSLGGVIVGFLILFPFYVLGGMGAGDVKLLAAAGTFLGPYGALLAGLFTLLAGGVLAMGMLLQRRLGDWRVRHLPLTKSGDPNASYLPYSLAISAGVLVAVLRW